MNVTCFCSESCCPSSVSSADWLQDFQHPNSSNYLLKHKLLHCKNFRGYMARMFQNGIHNIIQKLGQTHLQTVVYSNSKGGDSFKKTSQNYSLDVLVLLLAPGVC